MTKNITVKWKILGYACGFVHALFCPFNIIIQKKYIFGNIKSKWNSCPVYVIAWSMLFCTLFAGAVSLIYIEQPENLLICRRYSNSTFTIPNLYNHWIILYSEHMVYFSNQHKHCSSYLATLGGDMCSVWVSFDRWDSKCYTINGFPKHLFNCGDGYMGKQLERRTTT